MPITISEIQALRRHISGIMERANHHAQNVYKVAPMLCGLIIWKADTIEIRMHEGSNANMIWINVANSRYALTYNHESAGIEIRERSQQGETLMTINNDTDPDEIIALFSAL